MPNVGVKKVLAIGVILIFGILVNCNWQVWDNPGPTLQGTILSWTPPTTYADGTPLNPETDLQGYEIYISPYPTFSENDSPVSFVSGGGVSSFDLKSIDMEPGPLSLWVCMKSVLKDGTKSDFSKNVEWEDGI